VHVRGNSSSVPGPQHDEGYHAGNVFVSKAMRGSIGFFSKDSGRVLLWTAAHVVPRSSCEHRFLMIIRMSRLTSTDSQGRSGHYG
jgi:hypothetical protein